MPTRTEIQYFAFGANTCRDVLERRRGIRPLASEAAELRDHDLAFVHPGIPILEPGFASVIAAEGCVVHGVLHVLSERDMSRLDATESAGYVRVERPVIGRTMGPTRAQLYTTREPVLGLRPSRRYLDLLIRGAREHDLPAPWVARLEATPCAYVPVISDTVRWITELYDVFGVRARQR